MTSDDHFPGDGSRVLTHVHRRVFTGQGTVTRRTHGGPICQVAGASARCDMLRSSTRSRACLAMWLSGQSCARIAAWLTRPSHPFNSSLRFSAVRIGASSCTRFGNPPSAVPFCYTESKFGETVNLKVNSFDNDTGSFDLAGSDLQSISCWKSRSPKRSKSTLISIPVPFVVLFTQFHNLPYPP